MRLYRVILKRRKLKFKQVLSFEHIKKITDGENVLNSNSRDVFFTNLKNKYGLFPLQNFFISDITEKPKN